MCFNVKRLSIIAAVFCFIHVSFAAGESASLLTLRSPALKDGMMTLRVGEEQKVELLDGGKLATSVQFESGNSGFFSVDNNGGVKALHEGTSLLAATVPGGRRETAVVVIHAKDGTSRQQTPAGRRDSVSDIVVANAGGVVCVGAVERIIAHVLPYQVIGTNPFRISSSDPSVMVADDRVKTIEALKPGRAIITVSTLDGRYQASVDYQVVPLPPPESVKTYAIEPARFGLVYGADDMATAQKNSAGLQAALDYAGSNGYGRVLLGKGTTLVIEPKDTIRMVSNVQFDLNGSEIRLRPNDYPRYSAFLFAEKPEAKRVLENASIVNGTITGERDFKESFFPNWARTPATEGGCSIVFSEGRNNGISNLVVRKSIGFNIASGLGSDAYGTQRFTNRTLGNKNVELGAFSAEGKPVESSECIRTIKPIDVAGLQPGFYVIGYPLGYMSYPNMNSRIYDICFYDADMKFLGIERGRYRYRQYALPERAAFAHFSFYYSQIPTGGSVDFAGAFSFVENRALPVDNYIIACTIEDNYSCGFAACGGQRWVIKNNVFRRNGGRMPGCDIDWEDGWEYMQGDLIEGNSFESWNNVIVCAGAGFVFRNNTFLGSTIFYGRAQHYSFVGNTLAPGDSGRQSKITFGSQTDFYTADNVYKQASVATSREHVRMPGAEYFGRLSDEVFYETSLSGGAAMSELTRCTFQNGTNGISVSAASFTECSFGSGTYLAAGVFKKVKTDNAIFSIQNGATLEFYDSTLGNPTFSAGTACVGLALIRCTLSFDKPTTFLAPNNIGHVRIANSTFAFDSKASPFIFSGGWNATGANTRIDLERVAFKVPEAFEGSIHQFTWYPGVDDPTKISYNLKQTILPNGFTFTDAKGEKSNAVFER